MNLMIKNLPIMLFIFACSFSSCSKEDTIEIPFAEYSLFETGCMWTNVDPNKVVIINNNNELEKHIICTYSTYSDVDFSEHTLLLVRGPLSVHVFSAENVTFLKKASQRYTIKIKSSRITTTGKSSARFFAILVPKLSNKATIKLDIQFL